MLTIKVVGSGCPNCRRVEEHARIALADYVPELEASIEKVTDPMQFIDYGVMQTPGLVINGKLVSSGRIPSPQSIAAWLDEAANTDA